MLRKPNFQEELVKNLKKRINKKQKRRKEKNWPIIRIEKSKCGKRNMKTLLKCSKLQKEKKKDWIKMSKQEI